MSFAHASRKRFIHMPQHSHDKTISDIQCEVTDNILRRDDSYSKISERELFGCNVKEVSGSSAKM